MGRDFTSGSICKGRDVCHLGPFIKGISLRYTKGVTFVNTSYTKGVSFLPKSGRSSSAPLPFGRETCYDAKQCLAIK